MGDLCAARADYETSQTRVGANWRRCTVHGAVELQQAGAFGRKKLEWKGGAGNSH